MVVRPPRRYANGSLPCKGLTTSGVTKSRSSVHRHSCGVLGGRPQAKPTESTLSCPIENLSQEGASNAQPPRFGAYPHSPDTTAIVPLLIAEAIRRANRVVPFKSHEHHMSPRLRDRPSEFFPVGVWPFTGFRKRFAK